jgi:hypothetical protein
METNSPASTNGANTFMLKNVPNTRMVHVPQNIDTEMAPFIKDTVKNYTLFLNGEAYNSEYDVPILVVELDLKSRTIVHQSATSAYAEYRTIMVGLGLNFRPYNQWLALATPMALAYLATVQELDQKKESQQTTA